MKFYDGLAALLIGAVTITLVQPQFAAAVLTAGQVSSLAKEVTVRIDGSSSGSNGSGVIIDKQENSDNITYTVITNWHVIEKQEAYIIRTSDDRTYVASQIQRIPGVDLAIAKFTSDKIYKIIERGNSDQLTEGQTIYFAGYPAPTQVETGRSYRFITTNVIGRVSAPKDGYALVYQGNNTPGMSGGPVLDENGRLVAINGETEQVTNVGQAGNYGIPINTFFALQPQAVNVAVNSINSSSRVTQPTVPEQTPTQTRRETQRPVATPSQPQTTAGRQAPKPTQTTTASEPQTPTSVQPPTVVSRVVSRPVEQPQISSPTVTPPTVVTSPRRTVVTPPDAVATSSTSLPEYIVPINSNRPISVPNFATIEALLQREGLSPAPCSSQPKVEIIGVQYKICAYPTPDRPAGTYELRTGSF